MFPRPMFPRPMFPRPMFLRPMFPRPMVPCFRCYVQLARNSISRACAPRERAPLLTVSVSLPCFSAMSCSYPTSSFPRPQLRHGTRHGDTDAMGLARRGASQSVILLLILLAISSFRAQRTRQFAGQSRHCHMGWRRTSRPRTPAGKRYGLYCAVHAKS